MMLSGITREFSGANTTIACVITNAALSKAECSIVSGMAHDGYARSIRPVHTTMDGDAIFTMASGEYETAISLYEMHPPIVSVFFMASITASRMASSAFFRVMF